MRHERLITEACMGRLVEWINAHIGFLSVQGDDPDEFWRGLFFIVDEELRGAMERERAQWRRRSQKVIGN